MKYILINLFVLLQITLFAQDELLEYRDKTYSEDIKTVQLHIRGNQLTLPTVELNAAMNTLELEFDLMSNEYRDYIYTLVHCNHDWQPSELGEQEYLEGFTEDRITTFENSFNTLVNYIHYRQTLPNRQMKWTKSGNYLLKVYEDDEERELVITRRFVVTESNWFVSAALARTAKVSKSDTHHEIDFTVKLNNSRVPNPQNDVHAYVIQNGNWNEAIGPLKPFVTRNDQLVYDYQDQIVFPGGKEFRFFDIRQFYFNGDRVRLIGRNDKTYEVTLQADEDRENRPYFSMKDANGRYVVENSVDNQGFMECDYANVLFSIIRNEPYEDKDVYVFGELTNWTLDPKFKMQYSQEVGVYYTEVLLKQGYYNYKYVVVDKTSGEQEAAGLEGNSYETSNMYTFLVYFRPFGDRYDRLMAVSSIDSGFRE